VDQVAEGLAALQGPVLLRPAFFQGLRPSASASRISASRAGLPTQSGLPLPLCAAIST
jgi:hypothetical protein